MKLQLKRSNVLDNGAAKQPTGEQLEYGELAVNYNEGDPAIFLKDSNDNVIRIAGEDPLGIDYVKATGDNMTGNLTLGTDKIQLTASDGAITAAGRLTFDSGEVGTYVSGGRLNAYGSTATAAADIAFSVDIADDVSGLNQKQTVKIKKDGSATFTGNIQSGGDPASRGDAEGIILLSNGRVEAASNQSSTPVWSGYEVGTAAETSSITAAGDATFSGTVTADSFSTSSGTPVGGSPTGAVMMFAGATVPTGWLECNGQAAPTALAAVLGQATVPDLRGEFVRGWDNGKGTDSGRVLLSAQGHGIQSHNHGVTDPGHNHTYNYWQQGSFGGANAAQRADTSRAGLTTASKKTGISINSAGGTETRPRNVALMYIIKT